ncbi:MAG: YcxB family protein [Terriglobales bacterium]
MISETGIDSSSPTGSTQSTWSAYTRYVESRNLFLLYQAPHVFSLLPKRAFAPGEEESFRGLLNAKLGAATAAHRRKISPQAWMFLAVVGIAAVLLVISILRIR